jgi:hypothetical protein
MSHAKYRNGVGRLSTEIRGNPQNFLGGHSVCGFWKKLTSKILYHGAFTHSIGVTDGYYRSGCNYEYKQ